MAVEPIDSGRVAARVAFLLVTGIWIGAMVYFAAVAAPAAFAALADQPGLSGRHLAGSVVRIALGTLNQSGVAMAVISLVLLYLAETSPRARVTVVVACLVVAVGAMSFVAHAIVSARLEELRTVMGVIDEVGFDDPRRIEFGRLHVVSVLILAVQILAAIGVFVMAGWRWMRPSRA